MQLEECLKEISNLYFLGSKQQIQNLVDKVRQKYTKVYKTSPPAHGWLFYLDSLSKTLFCIHGHFKFQINQKQRVLFQQENVTSILF